MDEIELVSRLTGDDGDPAPDEEAWARLRRALAAAGSAEVSRPSGTGQRSRVPRRRRAFGELPRWRVSLVGVVTVLVLGGLSGVGLALSASGPPPRTSPTITRPRIRDRYVSYHGLEIPVPLAWKLDDQRCGTPEADTVLWLDTPVETCYAVGPQHLTVVGLRSAPAASVLRGVRTRPVVVDDVAGREALGPLPARLRLPLRGHEPETLVILPALDAAVLIAAPTRASELSLISRIKFAPVNALGCQDESSGETPSSSYRPGSARELVPGSPSSAVACAYSGKWLQRSSSVPRANGVASSPLTILQAGLDSLARGYSTAPRPGCRGYAKSWVEFRFRYRSGPVEEVSAVLANRCGELGAGNGLIHAVDSRQLADTVQGYIWPMSGGFPSPGRVTDHR